MFKDDDEIREEIANDKRTFGAMLDDILLSKSSRENRAYFNPADPLHDSVVRKVEILMAEKHGTAQWAREVMPILSKTDELPYKKSEQEEDDFDDSEVVVEKTIRSEWP